MTRCVLVVLGVAFGGVAAAQNAEVIREVKAAPRQLQPPAGLPRLQPVPGVAGRPFGTRTDDEKPKRPAKRVRTTGPTPGGPPRFDAAGDRLPPGAVARFGSARLRHGPEPAALHFTPSGSHLVSVSVRSDGLRFWDVKTGRETARLDVPLTCAAVARDGHVVFVSEGRGRVWHPESNATRDLPAESIPEGTAELAVSPDGRAVVAMGPQKAVAIDFASGKVLRELKVPGGQTPTRVAYSPDGRWLAAIGPRSVGVLLWDVQSGKRVRTYPVGETNEACEFAFSPRGDRIAVATTQLKLYALDSEEEVEGFAIPTVQLLSPAFSDDGKTLFAQTTDGTVVGLDAATGAEKLTWASPHPDQFRPPFALAAGARAAAATDQSGGIHVWNPRTGEKPVAERFPLLSDPGVSADGKSVTFLDAQARVHAIDLATGGVGRSVRLGLEPDTPATWDARTRRAAAVPRLEEAEIQLIDADTGKVLTKFPTPVNSGLPVVKFCSSVADRVAVFSPGVVSVVNVGTGAVVRTIQLGHGDEHPAGGFSPDGRLIVTAAGTVAVWEVATGRRRFDLDALANPRGATFSPDGRFLAAWDDTDTVLVFDLRAGSVVRRFQLPGADGSLSAVAFSPDGKRLATGNEAGGVSLWDVATGDSLLVLDGHDGQVTGFAFAPDGSRLLSTATDGTALLWDLTARPQTPAANAGVTGFDDAFDALGSADARLAQGGIEFFYRHPDDAVKQLARRVAVPAAVPAERIAKLIADLDRDDYPTRTAAAKDLEAIGGQAALALREVLEKTTSAEVRTSAAALYEKALAPAATPDELRLVRAVEVAENLGTPAARGLLKTWAAGPPGHRLTAEAAAALGRRK